MANKSSDRQDMSKITPPGFKPKVAVVGMGVVGSALHGLLSTKQDEFCGPVMGFDKDKSKEVGPRYVKTGIVKKENAYYDADVVFICVPTPWVGNPFTPGGRFEGHAVMDAMARVRPGAIAVIRSTVPPVFAKGVEEAFPSVVVVTCPEFLDEDTAVRDTMKPSRIVVGANYLKEGRRQAADRAKLMVCPRGTSTKAFSFDNVMSPMAVKLLANGFFTVKNAYFNMASDLCHASGLPFDDIRAAVTEDSRIGNIHTYSRDKGGRGAGGTCLPKDMEMLKDWANYSHPVLSSDVDMLRHVSRSNATRLKSSKKSFKIACEVYGLSIS